MCRHVPDSVGYCLVCPRGVEDYVLVGDQSTKLLARVKEAYDRDPGNLLQSWRLTYNRSAGLGMGHRKGVQPKATPFVDACGSLPGSEG